jgi:hypothetical protein
VTPKPRTPKRQVHARRRLRKTSLRAGRLRNGEAGGQLRVGNPGNKGGGSLSTEYKEHLAGLADKAERSKYMTRCLSGKLGWKAFAWAAGYCSDRSRGKPTQPVSGPEGGPIHARVTVHFA